MLSNEVVTMLLEGTRDTLYMTFVSAIFSYLFAFPIGIALVITKKDGLRPMTALYRLLDIIVNIGRSVPFLIANFPKSSYSAPPNWCLKYA